MLGFLFVVAIFLSVLGVLLLRLWRVLLPPVARYLPWSEHTVTRVLENAEVQFDEAINSVVTKLRPMLRPSQSNDQFGPPLRFRYDESQRRWVDPMAPQHAAPPQQYAAHEAAPPPPPNASQMWNSTPPLSEAPPPPAAGATESPTPSGQDVDNAFARRRKGRATRDRYVDHPLLSGQGTAPQGGGFDPGSIVYTGGARPQMTAAPPPGVMGIKVAGHGIGQVSVGEYGDAPVYPETPQYYTPTGAFAGTPAYSAYGGGAAQGYGDVAPPAYPGSSASLDVAAAPSLDDGAA